MLEDKAEAEVRNIEAEVERMLAADGELGSPSTLTEWGSKYVGAVVRIAGLLHFAEHGEAGHSIPVTPDTIVDAEQIGDWFKAVAINVFQMMGADPDVADAIYLLEVIKRLGHKEVSLRELFTASSRSRFSTKASMMPAVNRLIDHGYLIPLETLVPTGPGRPASPRYNVHTSILE